MTYRAPIDVNDPNRFVCVKTQDPGEPYALAVVAIDGVTQALAEGYELIFKRSIVFGGVARERQVPWPVAIGHVGVGPSRMLPGAFEVMLWAADPAMDAATFTAALDGLILYARE